MPYLHPGDRFTMEMPIKVDGWEMPSIKVQLDVLPEEKLWWDVRAKRIMNVTMKPEQK